MLTKKEVIAQLHNMGIDLTPPIHWPKSPKEQMVISLPIYKAKALGLAPNELLKIVTYGGKYGIEREAFSVAKRNPAILQ